MLRGRLTGCSRDPPTFLLFSGSGRERTGRWKPRSSSVPRWRARARLASRRSLGGSLVCSLFAVTVLGAGLSDRRRSRGHTYKWRLGGVRSRVPGGKGLPVWKQTSRSWEGNSSRQWKPLLSVKLRSDFNSRRQPSELNLQKRGAIFPHWICLQSKEDGVLSVIGNWLLSVASTCLSSKVFGRFFFFFLTLSPFPLFWGNVCLSCVCLQLVELHGFGKRNCF